MEETPDGITIERRIADENFRQTENDPVSPAEVRNFHNVVDTESGGEGKTVVVCGGGIDDSHSVFDDTTISHVDLTEADNKYTSGHATACAGLIVQMAPNVDLISLRVFDGSSTSLNLIYNGYQWLGENSSRYDAVSMSWGATQTVSHLNDLHNQLEEQSDAFIGVSAGNSGSSGGSPATASDAFSVGACTTDGKMAKFSSSDPNLENPDISALGKNIVLARASGTSMGTVINKGKIAASGTSFSAPLCVGMHMALTSEGHSVSDVTTALSESARNIPETPDDGAGVVDMESATKSLQDESEGEIEFPDWFVELIKHLYKKVQ